MRDLKKRPCKKCGAVGCYQQNMINGDEEFRWLHCKECGRIVIIEDDIEAQVRMMQAVSLTRRPL
jgi:uncharacterized Zn finger protein